METMPKRRWSRFSLRTLLVLVSIASAGFGWLGVKVRQAQQQREAVKAIQNLGALEVRYDYQMTPDGKFDNVTLPPGPVWLRKLLGDDAFANVVLVILADSEVTDADLILLHEFP